MKATDDALPIEEVLTEVIAALRDHGRAVLQAPPGAGKTTRVPLALLEAGVVEGTLLMLEPRRLAARAAAERMASVLGEPVGQTVGYRMRGEAKAGPATRIEVVTEGILTARLQRDPELRGVGAVVFDEFHERSLNADLGLALTWEARQALREDLKVLVMSATLDAAPVAEMLGHAPVVTSAGRMHPVETRWLDRPLPAGARLEAEAAQLLRRVLSETEGGVLVFLPGAGEISRVAGMMGELPKDVRLHQLFGAADARAQRAAIAPEAARKLVLATSIAETSLTIPGIRVVVDAGRARRARFDPGTGMSRLVTERVTRAEADQRRGRAGREAPGVCYRLWARAEEGALPAYPPPEIETADLAGLALDLAAWGAEPDDLAFLTPPPAGPMAEARGLLNLIEALDDAGRITAHGRTLARLPVHPRLAHMLVRAGPAAARLAALLEERDPLPREAPADIDLRLAALAGRGSWPADTGVLHRVRAEAKRLERLVDRPKDAPEGAGAMAALAYPDRIGMRRPGEAPRWQLSGGSGARMDAGQALAQASFLVVCDSDGDRREARIRLAAGITPAELREVFANRITTEAHVAWDRREARVLTERRERLFALVLSSEPWPDAPPEAVSAALLEGLADKGLAALKFSPAVERLRNRVALARARDASLPDFSDGGLMASAGDWFLPQAQGARRLGELAGRDWLGALTGLLGWEGKQALDRIAPGAFETPLGRSVPVDYSGGVPRISVRLQEMFGVTEHPVVSGQALLVELLSPAGRPLQLTQDLPGFWASSYADVRRDMRGRYPKHPWPEDPASALPTSRAKPR